MIVGGATAQACHCHCPAHLACISWKHLAAKSTFNDLWLTGPVTKHEGDWGTPSDLNRQTHTLGQQTVTTSHAVLIWSELKGRVIVPQLVGWHHRHRSDHVIRVPDRNTPVHRRRRSVLCWATCSHFDTPLWHNGITCDDRWQMGSSILVCMITVYRNDSIAHERDQMIISCILFGRLGSLSCGAFRNLLLW